MRRLLFAVTMVIALLAFGATLAYAGDCGKCAPKCGTSCKPKCETKCNTKCESKCAPKCDTGCKPKCSSGWCSEKPKCDTPCKPKCQQSCDPCGPRLHPYEALWRCAGPRLCDGGCEENCIAVFPRCETCTTTCEKVESRDCCGCTKVSYSYQTVCTELERPRVIPWWFNENGAGNIYLDDED